jgi:hypothetical protein
VPKPKQRNVIDQLAHEMTQFERDLKTRHGDEDAEREERKRRRQMQAELTEEAWFYIDRIVAATKKHTELSYKYKQNEREPLDAKYNTIKFSHVVLQPEAIYLLVDTAHLPHEVKPANLRKDETLELLGYACRHPVLAEGGPEEGFWYVIERTTGVRGMATHVQLAEAWATRGKSHDSLSLCFGIGENRSAIWWSFTNDPSLLIGGSTNAGKSNMMHVALCTLLRFNAPEKLKLALVDLKYGVELGRYEKVPHLFQYRPLDEKYDPQDDEGADDKLVERVMREAAPVVVVGDAPPDEHMRTAFVEHPARVLPMLRAVYWEVRRRFQLFRAAGVRDISNYNWRHQKTQLPRLMLVFDELASLKALSPADEQRAKKWLSQIAALGRAAGVHSIAATQRPEVSVISGDIKQNFTMRLALRCADTVSSQTIIGNGAAAALPDVKGRALLGYGSLQREVQTPYISDQMLTRIIDEAVSGEHSQYEVRRHDVTSEDLWMVAVEEFGGKLPADEIYRYFAGRQRPIPREEVREIIRQHLGQEIMVRGAVHRVHKGEGTRPPYLEVVEGS